MPGWCPIKAHILYPTMCAAHPLARSLAHLSSIIITEWAGQRGNVQYVGVSMPYIYLSKQKTTEPDGEVEKLLNDIMQERNSYAHGCSFTARHWGNTPQEPGKTTREPSGNMTPPAWSVFPILRYPPSLERAQSCHREFHTLMISHYVSKERVVRCCYCCYHVSGGPFPS